MTNKQKTEKEERDLGLFVRGDSEFFTKDSGKREKFGSGAVRDTHEDKSRFDLIPPLALKRVADLYTRGAIKYDERNWEKGIPISRCYASLMRHVFQYGMGDIEEDHLAAVAWNALAIMHFEETMRFELWDMPFHKQHQQAQDFVRAIKTHNDKLPKKKR